MKVVVVVVVVVVGEHVSRPHNVSLSGAFKRMQAEFSYLTWFKISFHSI